MPTPDVDAPKDIETRPSHHGQAKNKRNAGLWRLASLSEYILTSHDLHQQA